jgi:hypothetical protein
MFRFFAYFIEILRWIQITIVIPIILFFFSLGIYSAYPSNLVLYICAFFIILGFIFGAIWATRIWKTKGTSNFISKIYSSPDFDNLKIEDRKRNIIHILNHIQSKLNEDTDIIRTQSTDLIKLKNNIILLIENLDLNNLKDVSFLFAPTGTLQEISLENGWGDEFIELSIKIDELVR